MYTAGDIITKAGIDIMTFKQLVGQSTVELRRAPWTEALRCGSFYEEYCYKGTFIKGLRLSILQSILRSWAKIHQLLLQ